jgi:hypothetical protein
VVAPDGSWLASASGGSYTHGEIRLWDPTSGQKGPGSPGELGHCTELDAQIVEDRSVARNVEVAVTQEDVALAELVRKAQVTVAVAEQQLWGVDS